MIISLSLHIMGILSDLIPGLININVTELEAMHLRQVFALENGRLRRPAKGAKLSLFLDRAYARDRFFFKILRMRGYGLESAKATSRSRS